MTNPQHRDKKATQVAHLEVRLKVLAVKIVAVFQAAKSANASASAMADALITYLHLEEMVQKFGVPQLLQLSEFPLSTQSQEVLDELEAILNDPNRMEAGKLAAAAGLLLGEQHRLEPPHTVH